MYHLYGKSWRIIATYDTHINYDLILRARVQLVGNFYLLRSTSWDGVLLHKHHHYPKPKKLQVVVCLSFGIAMKD